MPAPRLGAVYYALIAPSSLTKATPYREVTGSYFGLALDDPHADGCGHVYSTATAAESARAALPPGSFGRTLVVAPVRWHGGCIFTATDQ